MVKLTKIADLKLKLFNFLDLTKYNNFLVLTDDDEDGLTSALQIKKFLISNKKKVNVFFNEKGSIVPTAIKEEDVFKEFFDETNPDFLIFLDLNESTIINKLKLIDDSVPILIIDHHPSPKEIIFKNPLFVLKPNMFSDLPSANYSTTKIVYDFFDGDELNTVIGLIGDSATKNWVEFIKTNLEKNNLNLEQAILISDIIKSVCSYKGDKYKLFDFIFENKISAILGSEFEKSSIEFQEEIKSEIKRFDKDAEIFKNLDLAFFETKNGLPSKLSNMLSKKFTYTLVIFARDDYTKGSVRRNDFKVNAGELIKYAIKNDSIARGGGHIPAGGFACLNDYWQEFKKRAIEFALNNPPLKVLD